ncbi:hypothetical protein TNCV_2070581 [Trichonephila clavipes]|uniref:Uncharacterized protein n=1 Tax=Trichonephila clavipes TaxID=2585209 RepID=A0A8X7BDH4_TRICX|nr:hypothetical protein TNCV_2070581 [Trichonephila clavipes]
MLFGVDVNAASASVKSQWLSSSSNCSSRHASWYVLNTRPLTVRKNSKDVGREHSPITNVNRSTHVALDVPCKKSPQCLSFEYACNGRMWFSLFPWLPFFTGFVPCEITWNITIHQCLRELAQNIRFLTQCKNSVRVVFRSFERSLENIFFSEVYVDRFQDVLPDVRQQDLFRGWES